MSKFFSVVQKLIVQRNKFPKRSYENEFYKLLANSGIGQMGRGFGGKKALDVNLTHVEIPSGPMSNPLYPG